MKKRDKNPLHLLSSYLRWPVFISVLLVLLNAGLFVLNFLAGLVMLPITIIILGFSVYLFVFSRKILMDSFTLFSRSFESTEANMLRKFSIPSAVTDLSGRVIWKNQAFTDLMKAKGISFIQDIFPDVTEGILRGLDEPGVVHSSFNSRRYALEVSPHLVSVNKQSGNKVIFVTASDETDLLRYKKLSEDISACEGLIYLDNYDDVFENVEEVRRSLLQALVDRRISGYISNLGGVVKKLEKDKYFFFVKNADLEKILADNFSILEDVKNINIGGKMKNAVSVSIGVGRHGANYRENDTFARSSIDFAMGRGGDQAVLKDGENVIFYGGKTEAKEKHTRVKARVKADALAELMNSCDFCLVMGHKNPDVDSLGASMGFWRIADSFGKRCHVVISNPTRSLKPVYNWFKQSSEYGDELFVDGNRALEMINDKTMVVVVDVNRPSRTEEPLLLKKSNNIAVVDHHRISSEVIKNAALTYIEPYASSACEMMTEIIEYLGPRVKLDSKEADAMYGGILIDTQNFTDRTGVRTFEAAAYLKRAGADSALVRKSMRDSANDYRALAATVERAEIYRDAFAISECDATQADSPTVIGAQAANSLLEIDGIKAAVVMTVFDEKIYVSARSIDEVNVQVMMEKLGGGGHMTIAGAQLSDITMNEAREKIKACIDEMIEKGDIK